LATREEAKVKESLNMPGFPLRHYGPRVFISYSFRDAALAESLHASLAARGFQVSREDETSLVNQRLTEAIPQRIAQAEVLIQLRTSTSNLSDWVTREFAYAVEARGQGQSFVILPVVFDKSTLPDSVKEWWFLDVEGTGLTDEAIDQIERICLGSVHLLPLSDDDPLSVAESDLLTLLRKLPGDGRRVIVDSGGRLLGWTQESLDYCAGIDSPYRDQILAQEKRRLESLAGHYKVVDEVVRKLALEVMRVMEGYTTPAARAARALVSLKRFTQIIVGSDVLKAASMAPPEPHPLRSKFKDRIEAARAANSEGESPGYLNAGFYAWVFGIEGGADSMAYMGLDAQGFRGIPIQIPASAFGTMADLYTTTPGFAFDPKGELLTGTFVDYVLPQVAAHAAYNLTDETTAREDLEQLYAWRLEQYDSMGLH
jgi:TIR domain